MDDPYMGFWRYNYDENGNLIWQKDGKGNETVMEYDTLNRIKKKTLVSDDREINYTYDEVVEGYFNIGNLTTIENIDTNVEPNEVINVIDYNYDEMGRQVNEKRSIDDIDYEIDREYDLAGRLDYITYPADGPEIDYSYHPIGFLSQIDKVDSVSTMLAQYDMDDYNALGQVGYVLYGNNAETSNTYYDGNFRLKTLDTYDGQGNPIQELEYTFDDVGNLETIEDDLNGVTQSFGYDEVNRLTSADASGGSDPSRTYDQGFTYDLAGNIEEKTGIGGYTVMEWKDSLTHIKPKAVNFDEEVAGVADRNIVYNQDNMPIEITYAGGTTTLEYDGEGNRIKKVKGSETVIYVGDIYEIRGEETLSYIYANGKKIVTLTDDNAYYTHSDHLGSTSMVTNEDGDAVEEIGYLPFGAVLFRNVLNDGTWESAYRFTGQEFDPEYHLYNYDARLYDPVVGRFISPDTIVPEPFNPQSLNRYAYCLNNPLRYTDPSGHQNDDDDDELEEYTLEEITVTAQRTDNSYWWLVGWGGTVLVDGIPQYGTELLWSAAEETIGTIGTAAGVVGVVLVSPFLLSGDADPKVEKYYREKAENDKKAKEEKAKDSLETDKAKDVRETIKDKESNPENWEETNKNEKSIETGRYKGQTNIEREYTNKNTGDKLYEHEIKNSNGKTTHGPHYRGYPK